MEITIERYNELLRKETVYEIQRMRVMNDKYRSDYDCFLFDVITRSEEAELQRGEE